MARDHDCRTKSYCHRRGVLPLGCRRAPGRCGFALHTDQATVSLQCCTASPSLVATGAEKFTVVTFGRGEDGQLGHGTADEQHEPTVVKALQECNPETVVCGAEYTIALCNKGNDAYSWGWCAACPLAPQLQMLRSPAWATQQVGSSIAGGFLHRTKANCVSQTNAIDCSARCQAADRTGVCPAQDVAPVACSSVHVAVEVLLRAP